jgi:hypothetical protein
MGVFTFGLLLIFLFRVSCEVEDKPAEIIKGGA